MVPAVVSQAIWALVFTDPLLALLTIEPTSGHVVELYGGETTPWGATGVVAKWRSEGTQVLSHSKLATSFKQVRLSELYAFVLATEELLEDTPRLTDRLNVKAPRRSAGSSSRPSCGAPGPASEPRHPAPVQPSDRTGLASRRTAGAEWRRS